MTNVDVTDLCAAAGAGRVHRYRNRSDQLRAVVVCERESTEGVMKNQTSEVLKTSEVIRAMI